MKQEMIKKAGVLVMAAALLFADGPGRIVQAEEWNEDGIMPLSGIEDITAPTATAITLGAERVEAPGSLEVIVEAEDDVSGVSFGFVSFRNPDTGKILQINVSGTYVEPGTYQEVVYADGKLHGNLTVDQYASAGNYVVERVEIHDKAENYQVYYGMGAQYYDDFKESQPESILPDSLAGISFLVVNSGIQDVTAPVVTGIFLGGESIAAPGELAVTMEAEDDVSGVDFAWATFRNPDTDTSLQVHLSGKYMEEETGQEKEYGDGKLHGKLQVNQYAGSGTYTVERVEIHDKAGNYHVYYGLGVENYQNYDQEYLLAEGVSAVGFSVINGGTEDITAPIPAGVTLSASRVEVPAAIEVTVDGKDDVSGAVSGWVQFINPDTGKSLYASLNWAYFDPVSGETKVYADGKLHGEMEVSHYTGTGTYVIERVELRDRAENYGVYYGPGFESYDYFKENQPEALLPEALADLSVYVYNDGKGVDVTATTTTPDLAEQIQNAEDGAEILVDYSSSAILKKDIFEAIRGTEKTLSLVSEDGIQWIFHGADITNDAKDIDLKVSLDYISQSAGEHTEEIEELVEDTKTVILRFPENGVLPGKAKIRIKADYSMRQYLGETAIYVYYFDSMTKELVPIAADLTVTQDHYIEFEIEHCSYYVMTAGEVEKKEDTPQKPEDNQKPADDQGQNGPDSANGKEDSAAGSTAAGGQETKSSPKTGEDIPVGLYFGGGMIVLAVVLLWGWKQKLRGKIPS